MGELCDGNVQGARINLLFSVFQDFVINYNSFNVPKQDMLEKTSSYAEKYEKY